MDLDSPVSTSCVPDTGLSVLYAPDGGEAAVDILFVHGLQGHPYKTWASKRTPNSPLSANQPPISDVSAGPARAGGWGGLLPRRSKSKAAISELPDAVFWPKDFLPAECPNARILTWGYDSRVTKLDVAVSANKGTIFSYAKDLMFELRRLRSLQRRVIFVAHSLGGIIVKEVLASAAASADPVVSDIVQSTSAVVFLGTPHRGSKGKAKIGDVVRKVADSDLERVQDNFSTVWNKYDFQVKTFQEGLALTGIDTGPLGEKVVPDYSSLIGDSREQAETLQANHMNMCRFDSRADANYVKVSSELRMLYQRVVAVHENGGPTTAYSASPVEAACLRSLKFQGMGRHFKTIKKPVDRSYGWLSDNACYQSWRSRRNVEIDCGFLRITGKPGCGKSTLMRHTLQTVYSTRTLTTNVAAFYFNDKGVDMERSRVGMFRSLLYHLLSQEPSLLAHLAAHFKSKQELEPDDMQWTVEELEHFFEQIFQRPRPLIRTIIFVDGLDEGGEDCARNVARFFRQLTRSAHSSGDLLDVCLSSRRSPNITLDACPEMVLDRLNAPDIALYVRRKLDTTTCLGDEDGELLRGRVISEAGGVFLWVVLAVDKLLRDLDGGRNISFLLDRLRSVPPALEGLFCQLLREVDDKERYVTLRLFQWATLAQCPLRLREWHHILAFSRETVPKSLREWRASKYCTQDDDQLERQIRALSKGLVEVATAHYQPLIGDDPFDQASQCASAGSLNSRHGETRVVQVIHQSVREYFLNGDGFNFLTPRGSRCTVGLGHLAIIDTCIDCAHIEELSDLVKARGGPLVEANPAPWVGAETPPNGIEVIGLPPSRAGSVASFGSAGSDFSLGSHSAEAHSEEAYSEDAVVQGLPKDPSAFEVIRRQTSFPILRSWAGDESPSDDSLDRPRSEPSKSKYYITAASSAAQTGHSRILDDFPTLLHYALEQVFTHARLAQEIGADPSQTVRRFRQAGIWNTWRCLDESLERQITLTQHAVSQGLDSWVSCLLKWGESSMEILRLAKDMDQVAVGRSVIVHGTSGWPLHGGPLLHDLIQSSQEHLLLYFWKQLDWLARDGKLQKSKIHRLINTKYDGKTPLHQAAEKGEAATLEELIRRGADATAVTTDKSTVLHLLAESTSRSLDRFQRMVQLLVHHGVSVDMQNRRRSNTALHTVCWKADATEFSYGAVRCLIEHSANPMVRNQLRETPLHLLCQSVAVIGSHIVVTAIHILLQLGADIEAKDKYGRTPRRHLEWAPYRESPAIQMLLKGESDGAEAVLPCGDWRKESGAHGVLKAIELLVLTGSDVHAQDSVGQTPLHRLTQRPMYSDLPY